MGKLQFNAERMSEVYNRLDEIQEQLTNATNANCNLLNSIKENITGDIVINTLTTYSANTKEISNEIIRLTNEIKGYLQVQISNYSATETQGQETISDVKNILSQIEGGV